MPVEGFPHARPRWVRTADTFLNNEHATCGCDPPYAFLAFPLDLTLGDGFGYKSPRCEPTQTQPERYQPLCLSGRYFRLKEDRRGTAQRTATYWSIDRFIIYPLLQITAQPRCEIPPRTLRLIFPQRLPSHRSRLPSASTLRFGASCRPFKDWRSAPRSTWMKYRASQPTRNRSK